MLWRSKPGQIRRPDTQFRAAAFRLPFRPVGCLKVAEAGPSKIPVGASTANAHRDDMKCSEKSYQQQFTRPTRQLADDKSRLPVSTYGAGTRWSSRKIASSRAWRRRSHACRYGHLAAPIRVLQYILAIQLVVQQIKAIARRLLRFRLQRRLRE